MHGQKYHIESKQKKHPLFSKNKRKQDELLRRTHRRYMDEVAGRAIAKYKIWSWSLDLEQNISACVTFVSNSTSCLPRFCSNHNVAEHKE